MLGGGGGGSVSIGKDWEGGGGENRAGGVAGWTSIRGRAAGYPPFSPEGSGHAFGTGAGRVAGEGEEGGGGKLGKLTDLCVLK